MDRMFRHHERRLDTDLIERIEANGPQGRKPPVAKKKKKEPSASSS